MGIVSRFFIGFLFLSTTGAWADNTPSSFPTPSILPNHGVFLSVSGQVKVKSRSGHHKKTAQAGMDVAEGQTVLTSDQSNAVIQFFDGSQLTVSPNTQFKLSTLQQLPGQDKNLHFSLLVGKLLAKVTKLFSAKSSFEIDAGGVVCGVRGTEFEETATETGTAGQTKVTIQVIEGTVWATSGGQTNLIGAGQEGTFISHGNSGTGGNGGSGSSGGKTSGTGGGSGSGSGGSGGGSNNSGSGSGSSGTGGTGGSGSDNGGSTGGGSESSNDNGGSTGDNNGGSGSGSGSGSDAALGDQNGTFTGETGVNGDNNLNAAQQNLNIHLVVPVNEGGQ